MMEYVKTLSQVPFNEPANYGTHACQLARLHAAGIPTPPSFVLSTAAWEKIVAQNRLRFKIDFILHHVHLEHLATLQNAHASIRKIIMDAEIPQAILQELSEAYESLSIAPKSALIDEVIREEYAPVVNLFVSPTFVPIAETYEGFVQNVHGFEQLLIALKEAYAMMFSPDNIIYRSQEKLNERKVAFAVIVETMLPAHATVTAYSTDPSEPDKLFLETYRGFVDVRDAVAKDFHYIKKDFLATVKSQVVDQPTLIAKQEDGELALVEFRDGRGQNLNEKELLEIGRLAKKAEQTLANPVKCLFTVSKGAFFLLCVTPYAVPNVGLLLASTGRDASAAEPVTIVTEEHIIVPAEEPKAAATAPVAAAGAAMDDSTKRVLANAFRLIYKQLARKLEAAGANVPATLAEVAAACMAHGIPAIDLDKIVAIQQRFDAGDAIGDDDRIEVLSYLNDLLGQ